MCSCNRRVAPITARPPAYLVRQGEPSLFFFLQNMTSVGGGGRERFLFSSHIVDWRQKHLKFPTKRKNTQCDLNDVQFFLVAIPAFFMTQHTMAFISKLYSSVDSTKTKANEEKVGGRKTEINSWCWGRLNTEMSRVNKPDGWKRHALLVWRREGL